MCSLELTVMTYYNGILSHLGRCVGFVVVPGGQQSIVDLPEGTHMLHDKCGSALYADSCKLVAERVNERHDLVQNS